MNKCLAYANLCCEATPRGIFNHIQASFQPVLPPLPWIELRCASPHHHPSEAMLAHGRQASQTMFQMPFQGPQVTPLALLLLYDKGFKALCPGGHRTCCSLCTGHRAHLLQPWRADGGPLSVHSFIDLFTLTPWGYTTKLFRSEILFRYKELELGL